jgi:hypothetical protein
MNSYLVLFYDLLRLPSQWHVALKSMTLMNLIQIIEQDIIEKPRLCMPPEQIVVWVRRRVKYSQRWKNNRCLLRGLLLYRLLFLAGCPVTLHFGCKLDSKQLSGHCWIESPGLNHLHDINDACGNDVIISRNLNSIVQN